ncbi:MAG: hypothetical protein P4L51_21450 [Puia sp.]|nr:hypothetical protein [Puia sp.]
MFTIEFTVNILVIFAIALFSGFIGFKIKKGMGAKKQGKINQLEKEMLSNHTEILQLQKEYCLLEQKLKELTKPVIAMKIASKEEEQINEDQQREPSSLMKKLPTRSA